MSPEAWLLDLPFWPDRISGHAATVDEVMLAFALAMVLFTAPVFVAMTWFAIRYRRGSDAARHGRPRGSPWLETAWSLIPLAVMAVFFVRAADAYIDLRLDRPDALQIDVVAKQWMWKVQHPTGRRQINQLNVPAGTEVVLSMISQDVIHSMFLPALRIKQDVLPGRYTRLRFRAERTGTYHLTCAEYCGTLHSRMGGSLVVMEQAAYEAWAREDPRAVSDAAAGRRLYGELQCGACHDPGAPTQAPDLRTAPDRLVRLAGGGTVRAGDDYLREAIMEPGRAVVAGYRPTMPRYGGQLDEAQVRALIAYIRALPAEGRPGG